MIRKFEEIFQNSEIKQEKIDDHKPVKSVSSLEIKQQIIIELMKHYVNNLVVQKHLTKMQVKEQVEKALNALVEAQIVAGSNFICNEVMKYVEKIFRPQNIYNSIVVTLEDKYGRGGGPQNIKTTVQEKLNSLINKLERFGICNDFIKAVQNNKKIVSLDF